MGFLDGFNLRTQFGMNVYPTLGWAGIPQMSLEVGREFYSTTPRYIPVPRNRLSDVTYVHPSQTRQGFHLSLAYTLDAPQLRLFGTALPAYLNNHHGLRVGVGYIQSDCTARNSHQPYSRDYDPLRQHDPRIHCHFSRMIRFESAISPVAPLLFSLGLYGRVEFGLGEPNNGYWIFNIGLGGGAAYLQSQGWGAYASIDLGIGRRW